MKTFADIKRALTKGKSLTMLRHDWIPNNNKLIGVKRKIITQQSNAIQFEGGSWLYLDNPASHYVPLNDNSFSVKLDDNNVMTYEIN
jgi:hypothetical protein|tara:strand:+ start:720 stop:980 length:261 start_codon:yes stop_codon:yes gene_type:complete